MNTKSDTRFTLIQTKLDPLQISSNLVIRPRLIDYLNHNLDRNFTLISAPAGYGKTTLLVQWLNEIERPVAWLSLDEYDNDLALFLSYFLAAVRSLYPQGAERTYALLQAPSLPSPEVISAMLINDISALEEAFILALDDYHAIEDEVIREVIIHLIAHIPQNLHLVIATRQDPPLPLPRLRASWAMKEVRSNALRFTHQEVETFLTTMGIEELTADEIFMLDKRTEGWITGLRLIALAIHETADKAALIRTFQKMADPFIVEYLAAEVLASQKPDVQDFLLCTSILDRFCAPLCDATLGSSNSESILQELLQANLFVIPLGQERTWYRYHHLFQDLLQRRLREHKDLKKIQGLQSRASAWLADQGLIEEAIRHALASGEVESAARLIEEHRVKLLNREDWRPLRRWLDQLPKEVIASRPALLLTQTWIAVYHFDPLAIQSLLGRTETVLNERLEELPPDEVAAMQGEIDALYSYFLQTFDTKPDLSLARAEQALRRLPKENATARGLAQDFKAFAYQVLGRLDDAVQLLEDLISDPLQPSGVKTQSFIALSFVHFNAGDLSALSSTAARYLSYAGDLRRLPSVAWANCFSGLVAYEWNELQKAVEHFSVVADLDKFAVFLTYHSSILLLAKTFWIMGQKGTAQEILRTHEEKVIESGNPAFMMDVEALQAQFAVEMGDLDRALQWANRVDPDSLIEPMFADEQVSLQWAQILTGQPGRNDLKWVQEFLEQRLVLVESRHNIRRQIKILAQLSLVGAKLGQTDMALKQLKRSLQLALPQGYLRTFVDLGSEMSTLLRQMAAAEMLEESLSNYVSLLLAAFPELKAVTGPKEVAWQRARAVMPDPLTPRESEVLVLLAKRLKYREIAQSLVISMPTTKKHISHIYAKFGAKNRGEAIEKAKSLGILP